MAQHPEFYSHFTTEQREEFEDYAIEPGRTIMDCVAWITANIGISVPKSNVHRVKQRLEEEYQARRASEAGSLAKNFMAVIKDSGGLEIPDAATMLLAQRVYEWASKADQTLASTKDIANMSLAMQRLMTGKKRIEDVREDMVQRQKNAITAGEAIAKTGASSTDVVNEIKKALGVPV